MVLPRTGIGYTACPRVFSPTGGGGRGGIGGRRLVEYTVHKPLGSSLRVPKEMPTEGEGAGALPFVQSRLFLGVGMLYHPF